jgi:hypothetical protein
MSTLEERLHDALVSEGSRAEPSPDLFGRVVASIGDDRVRRRRLVRTGALWLVGTAAVAAAVLAFTPRDGKGLHMPWWILEVGTNVALLAIALWLGPFIKRFGRAYAADVFHDNPLTGKSYIVLTDIVYYLIFAAYILFSVHVAPQTEWHNSISGKVTAEQVTFELGRLGGILLIIGILHGLNIVLMPLLGRIFSLNRRLPGRP